MTEFCRYCRVSLKETTVFALLMDLGCSGSDPNYCHTSPDKKHDFITVAQDKIVKDKEKR